MSSIPHTIIVFCKVVSPRTGWVCDFSCETVEEFEDYQESEHPHTLSTNQASRMRFYAKEIGRFASSTEGHRRPSLQCDERLSGWLEMVRHAIDEHSMVAKCVHCGAKFGGDLGAATCHIRDDHKVDASKAIRDVQIGHSESWDEAAPTKDHDVVSPEALSVPTKVSAAQFPSNAISVKYEVKIARRIVRSSPISLVEQLHSYFPVERSPIETSRGVRGIDCLLELEQRRAQSIGWATWNGEQHEGYEEEQLKLLHLHWATLGLIRRYVFLDALHALDKGSLLDLIDAIFPEGSDLPGLVSERETAQECVRLKSTFRNPVECWTSEMELDSLKWSDVAKELLWLTDRTLKTIQSAQSEVPTSLAYRSTPPLPPTVQMPEPRERTSRKAIRKMQSVKNLVSGL